MHISNSKKSGTLKYKNTCSSANQVIKLLNQYNLTSIKQHVVITGLARLHAFTGIDCTKFFMRCKNCIYLHSHIYLPASYEHKLSCPYIRSLPNNKQFSVPYSSFIHYNNDYNFNLSTWKFNPLHNRKNIISFVSSFDTYEPISNHIRNIISHLCKNKYHSYCKQILIKYHGGPILSPKDTINLYHSSKFCLQPSGDTPTRKGIFDSILSGCIPIFFSNDSFNNEWDLFLDKSQKKDISLTFDPNVSKLKMLYRKEQKSNKKNIIKRTKLYNNTDIYLTKYITNVFEKLINIANNKAIIESYQKNIEKYAFSLQYSLIPDENLKELNRYYSPPYPDVVDQLLINLNNKTFKI